LKTVILRSTVPSVLGVLALSFGFMAPLVLAGSGAAGAASAASAGSAGSVGSSVARVALRGELPTIPSDVTRVGPVPGAQMLHLDVGLTGQDPAALAAEVAAVSTPGSPTYHHYLTSAQFAATYGPSAAEVDQVTTALQAEGLTVGRPTSGSSLLPVSGDASTISAAFGTPLEAVRLPDHLTSTVNTAAPQIPTALAGDITGIVGLSGLSEEHSMLRQDAVASGSSGTGSASAAGSGSGTGASGLNLTAHAAGPQACSDAASTAAGDSGYTSTQLSHDYGLDQLFAQGRTGIGQTIAIVEFEQFSAADIATFEGCYGLSNPVRTVTVDGTPSGSTSGSGEAALDIELAAVNAPSASLVVYQAPNETTSGTSLDLYNQIATDDVAQVITTSWGVCEQDNIPTAAVGQEEAIFERMAAQGQTMVAAAGDEGSEDCYAPRSSPDETQLAVDDPGSQPDVLSTGGTTLVDGAVAGQSAWNNCDGQALGFCQQNGGNGATGGGVSSVWPKPHWQPIAGGTSRTVPDLAYSADPAHGVAFYFGRDGGWTTIGGTSVVAPTLSGFLADTNQGCTATRGLVGPALYAANSATTFTDVTSGDNDFTGTNHGTYAAATGYDEATGLGTPIDQNLGLALQGGGGCPSVAGVSVADGSVTLTGGGLASATAVDFGAAGPGRIVSRTETSLVVAPPSPGKSLCVDVTVTNPLGTSAVSTADSFGFGGSGNCNGYRMVASDGGIFDFGSATFDGSTGGLTLQAPIVGMASTPDDGGYWLVAADGGVFSFGDARFFGSTGGMALNQPIVGMAATPDGGGYWLVAADGGIFTFGDAAYFGSTGGQALNRPIVGMAVAPGGGGYWLVASDGGIFTFGNAAYFGSTGSLRINSPIVTMAATPGGGGYWLVAADGGVFTFGDARFFGSTGSLRLNQPIVGMSATADGAGYWLVAADGGIFTFGDARFFGSTGGMALNRPIVGMSGN
jgi:hypothetical protein